MNEEVLDRWVICLYYETAIYLNVLIFALTKKFSFIDMVGFWFLLPALFALHEKVLSVCMCSCSIRERIALVGFRATCAEAGYGYVEYKIVVQHRKSRVSTTHLHCIHKAGLECLHGLQLCWLQTCVLGPTQWLPLVRLSLLREDLEDCVALA